MNKTLSILVLVLAALLEAGGDALMRFGLHSSVPRNRCVFFAMAAAVLFGYGWTVNAPPWDFGRLLGLYVVFFFVIAQLSSWLIFKQPPSPVILAGGGFIVVGGLIISFAKQ